MTQAQVNYEDIMNQVWDNIPKPKTLPQGSWKLRLRNGSITAPKEGQKSGRALFFYDAIEPMDDVDQSAIQALGSYDYALTEMVARFWVTPGNGSDLNKVRNHIEKHGVSTAGVTIGDSLKAIKNTDVIAYVTEQVNPKTGDMENVLSNFITVH
jgi:hypothetical protein